ncbi:dihydrofolate reductase family protein [Nonomuraea pusilla]|uniref:Dihydrofolate reductase n=1 Tax=Nonomuraea pusilla TaxID=46177 RepID=A0A1H7IVB1_9ACTN|nr:dihydrofolate reductase family protein [Nonomuraea pusilla]SEK66431.1 Dihydrofolate reductase [Nonomuraea pusilla]
MRKIVAGLFISLDGVVEAPETWHFPYFNDEMGQEVGRQMQEADAMLLGRRTYEEFASHWPHQDSSDPIAGHMNGTTKYVVSTTLTSLDWQNSTLVTLDGLSELKKQPGKNISIVGSPTLVVSLLREGLLDELNLLVHPIAVGKGKRLFPEDGAAIPLALTASATLSTGVLSLTYTGA